MESKREMTDEEEEVLNELEASENLENLINVQKEGCIEKRALDPNTKTLNMCRSCRYTVTIPSR